MSRIKLRTPGSSYFCWWVTFVAVVAVGGFGYHSTGDVQMTTRPSIKDQEIPKLDEISVYNINYLDPLALVREQAVRDDLRFIGVSGMGLSIPGLSNNAESLVGRDVRNYVIMKDTKDAFTSQQEMDANIRGRAFALQYNMALHDYLRPATRPADDE